MTGRYSLKSTRIQVSFLQQKKLIEKVLIIFFYIFELLMYYRFFLNQRDVFKKKISILIGLFLSNYSLHRNFIYLQFFKIIDDRRNSIFFYWKNVEVPTAAIMISPKNSHFTLTNSLFKNGKAIIFYPAT